jgi:hypothetical protein
VPDGVVAHLTRICGGNVDDRHVVDVTSGSHEKETYGANPHSGAYGNSPDYAAKNAPDLEIYPHFWSAYRSNQEALPNTANNWICYDFNKGMIISTHCTICTSCCDYLISWLIETSAGGKNWREVAREKDNE